MVRVDVTSQRGQVEDVVRDDTSRSLAQDAARPVIVEGIVRDDEICVGVGSVRYDCGFQVGALQQDGRVSVRASLFMSTRHDV